MRKTFITTMPDHAGAFLKASIVMADLGLNLTRVSYNKAIDIHTLFIEAEGTEQALALAEEQLRAIGYLESENQPRSVVLVEFRLPDVPGAVRRIAALIQSYHLNISYMSAQATGEDYQDFKMGLLVDEPEQFVAFLDAASLLCPVRVIDYDRAEKILDNTVFYIAFADQLSQQMGLGPESRAELIVNSNLVMQMLDERGEPFHKTFDFIQRFCDALSGCRGENFLPRITQHDLAPDVHLTLIEPPCGSNTCILRHGGKYLFVDSGYACYREEMLRLLRNLIPDFDTCDKTALLTHADVDHCGLLDLFDTVYMSARTRQSLLDELEEGGYRERNALHAPYVRICKTLTGYSVLPRERISVIGEDVSPLTHPLTEVGCWQFGDLNFILYEGLGGHLPGELVLVERTCGLVFSGDILINIKELLPAQAEHNRYAPYLMTSVDSAPAVCAQERRYLTEVLGSGCWHIFSGHGPRMDLTVQ